MKDFIIMFDIILFIGFAFVYAYILSQEEKKSKSYRSSLLKLIAHIRGCAVDEIPRDWLQDPSYIEETIEILYSNQTTKH